MKHKSDRQFFPNIAEFGPAQSILSSSQKRPVIALIIVVMIVFVLMLLTYRNEIGRFLLDRQSRQLNQLGNGLYTLVSDKLGEENPDYDSLREDIQFVSDGFGVYVWFVAPDGHLLYHTGYPKSLLTNLGFKVDEEPVLPEMYIGDDAPNDGYIITGGNYLGLFNEDGRVWLSYVRPVFLDNGELFSVMQLHQPYDQEYDRGWMFFNGLGFTLIIAFVFTLIFVVLSSYRLNKPLRQLAAVAERVARGDLSARVPSLQEEHAEDALFVQEDIANLNRTFNDMVERLEHQNTDRRDLMASISHDLRTPLTSISGFVDGMLDGTIPAEKYPRYLGIVQNETRRMSKMVTNIHEMVLLDSGGLNLDIRSYLLRDLVTEVVNGLENQLKEKSITVQTSFGEKRKSDLYVLADEAQIQRVFVNLLSNAVKFTPNGGVIAITVEVPKRSEFVTISIEDSGVGISEGETGLVFNRFYKGDRARSANEGSGLGLHIARRILSAHGQRIWAGHSEMGGAKFSFTMQIA